MFWKTYKSCSSSPLRPPRPRFSLRLQATVRARASAAASARAAESPGVPVPPQHPRSPAWSRPAGAFPPAGGSLRVRTPGAPPLAIVPPPAATWLNGTPAALHAESQSRFPARDVGAPFSTRLTPNAPPPAALPSVTGNKGRCHEPFPLPFRPRLPATWLNGNPTSRDLRSPLHRSPSSREPARSRPGTKPSSSGLPSLRDLPVPRGQVARVVVVQSGA